MRKRSAASTTKPTFRLMAAGDLHWDQHSRFDECRRIHDWIALQVKRETPDVFLVAGDVYERASTPLERAGVAAWISEVAEVCPVMVVKGNHDRHRDLELLGKLHTRHRIVVEERAGIVTLGRDLVGSASMRSAELAFDRPRIAMLAWPDVETVAAMADRPMPHDLLDAKVLEAVRETLRDLGRQLAQVDAPRILLTHAMIAGAKKGPGQPLIGQELTLSLEDLALSGVALVVAGHIHAAQSWMHDGMQVHYTGSPFRTAYGQMETKSILLAEFTGPQLTAVRRLPTPARGMYLVQGRWAPPAAGEPGELMLDAEGRALCANAMLEIEQAEIRIRYDVDADQQALAREAAQEVKQQLLAAGAADVKLEAQKREVVRATASEVGLALSLEAKLVAFWKAKGTMPGPDRCSRLLSKLGQLDTEVERAAGAAGAVQLHQLRFFGFRPYRCEVDIDVDAIPGLVVAVCGKNGVGKSTMLELVPAALSRRFPTHGTLVDMAISRAAFVEAVISNGRRWTIRQTVDAEARGGKMRGKSLVLDDQGQPAFEGMGVTTYDTWAEKNLLPVSLLTSTQFGVQRSTGFLDMTDGERTAVVMRAIGGERYEVLAARAGDRARGAWLERGSLEGQLSAAAMQHGDVHAEEAMLEKAKFALLGAEKRLAGAKMDAEWLRRGQELRASRARVSAALGKIGAEVQEIGRKIADDREGLVEQAEQIRDAAERVARLTLQRDETKQDLERGLRDHRSLVAEAEQYSLQASTAEKAASAIRGKGGRLDRQSQLRDRLEVVIATAKQEIGGAVAKSAEAEREVERLRAEVDRLEGARLASSEDRIDALRGALEKVEDQTEASTSREIASTALHADEQMAQRAAFVPARLKQARVELRSLEASARTRADVVREWKVALGREGELATVTAEIQSTQEELTAIESVVFQRRKDEALAKERAAIAQFGLTAISDAVAQLDRDIARYRPLAARAESLAGAKARIAEWAARLEQLDALQSRTTTELEGLDKEIAALPALDAIGVDARLRQAEVELRRVVSEVGAAERGVEQAKAGEQQLASLRVSFAAAEEEISDWERLSRDLGKNGLQSAEIDCVGPELSELANDLLHTCYSTRWTVTMRAGKQSKDGSKELDGFEALVYDSEDGRTTDARNYSPGQKAILGEAMANALSIVACRRAGVDGPTLFRDETSGLDAQGMRAYVPMLRRVAQQVGANKIFLISHSEEMQELADARIEIADGRVSGPGVTCRA
jgi:exonuclease SbcD